MTIKNIQTSMNVTEDEFKRRMRKSDYVCYECGRPYLTKKQVQEEQCSTFHVGECGLCGKTRGVTHIRNYNWLRVNKDIALKTSEENKGEALNDSR